MRRNDTCPQNFIATMTCLFPHANYYKSPRELYTYVHFPNRVPLIYTRRSLVGVYAATASLATILLDAPLFPVGQTFAMVTYLSTLDYNCYIATDTVR